MFFLCNRYKQIRDLEALDQGVVSDYHIHKNKIFASNTLDEKNLINSAVFMIF